MAWLLDTHVWLWSELEVERLGERTVSLLEDSSHPLVVSTVSTLEVARLAVAGRVDLEVSVPDWVDASLDLLHAETLELSHAIAAEAYALPEPFHRDPADRILVSTARVHGLDLVTADERILAYPHVRTLDARE